MIEVAIILHDGAFDICGVYTKEDAEKFMKENSDCSFVTRELKEQTRKMHRPNAANEYAKLIVKHGNPAYFIHKVINDWEDHKLIDEIMEMRKIAGLDLVKIEIIGED